MGVGIGIVLFAEQLQAVPASKKDLNVYAALNKYRRQVINPTLSAKTAKIPSQRGFLCPDGERAVPEVAQAWEGIPIVALFTIAPSIIILMHNHRAYFIKEVIYSSDY